MRLALFPPSSDPRREALRRRAVAIVLTILAHALLLLMLLRLAPEQFHLPEAVRLTTFSLMPEPEAATKRATTTDRSKQRSGGAPRQPPPPPAQQVAKIPPPPPIPVPPLNILPLSRQDMASADISHLHSDRGERESGQGDTTGTAAGPDRGAVYGPSLGGGGGSHQLYNAEWYREPTDAELSFYLPKNGQHVGYAMIACQTVERFHVDNCEILGDSPGSGFGRAMQQAAWQFLVRPPRVDGKATVGAWVRIRIDFTERGITK